MGLIAHRAIVHLDAGKQFLIPERAHGTCDVEGDPGTLAVRLTHNEFTASVGVSRETGRVLCLLIADMRKQALNGHKTPLNNSYE